MKRGWSSQKILSVLVTAVILFAFAAVQFFGLPTVRATIYDTLRDWRPGSGTLSASEKLVGRAEMTVNGRTVHLTHLKSKESVEAVLDRYAERFPTQRGQTIRLNHENSALLGAFVDNMITAVMADWDIPSQTTVITRAWAEIPTPDEGRDLTPAMCSHFTQLVEELGLSEEDKQVILDLKGRLAEVLTGQANADEQWTLLAPLLDPIFTRVKENMIIEDQPGFDNEDVPRVPGAARYLSVAQNPSTGGNFRMVGYRHQGDLEACAAFYDTELPKFGWELIPGYTGGSAMMENRLVRMYRRHGRQCMLNLFEDSYTGIVTSMVVILDKIR